MAYGDFKDLTRRTASDRVLRDKSFNIPKNPKYDGYQRELASVVYNLFDKKPKWRGIDNYNLIKQNIKLAEKLHKPIIKKIEKKKSLFWI